VSTCSGLSASLTVNGATSYTWSNEPGLSASSGSTVSANPTQTTTYTVTGTTGNCSSSSTVTITVNQLPFLDISPRAVTICVGEFASLLASGASTYSWAPASGLSETTGALVSASPGISTIYTVTGVANGCSSTDSILVTVNNPPSSDFSFNQTGDYTIDFVNNSEMAMSYLWTFMTDSNSTESNPSFTFPAPGIYPVELIATNSCGSDTSRQTINIVITSMYGLQNQDVWQVYPNPTAGSTVLRNQGLLLDEFSVEVYNDQGQMVDMHIANPSGKGEILLDFSEYKAGIYLIYLSGKQGSFAKKIIRL
jgi:PKD repeat protein